jgi:hypothetical protein
VAKIKYEIFHFKNNFKKSIFVSIFLFSLLIILLLFWGFLWFLLALLLFWATLNNYFFKITYQLDEEGITIKKIFLKNYRQWKEFKKILYTQNGLVLSPFPYKTYLDNFRGLHIFLPQNPIIRKAVVDFINKKILGTNLDAS